MESKAEYMQWRATHIILPRSKKDVLVSLIRMDHKTKVKIASYEEGKGWHKIGPQWEVGAWMPLPDAYERCK